MPKLPKTSKDITIIHTVPSTIRERDSIWTGLFNYIVEPLRLHQSRRLMPIPHLLRGFIVEPIGDYTMLLRVFSS